MLSLHPDNPPVNALPRPPHATLPLPDVASGQEPLCANPTCKNLVLEAWEETGHYCARCAIENDLFDRESRRERAFPPGPF